MPDELAPLDQMAAHPSAKRAQDYLALAHASASEALEAMRTLRQQRREAGGQDLRGRTSDQDQDLLRAMLVFACAGLDAAMKTLIRDALPTLADHHVGVQEKLTGFTEQMLSDGGTASPKVLARILSRDMPPRGAVIEAYVDHLTGGSLQSAEELDRVCGALGVDDAEIRKSIQSLRPVFRARNEIIHELDLNPDPHARHQRRHRAIRTMVEWASDALAVGQAIVNSVSVSLNGDGEEIGGVA